jgi:2-amino-4-hydroxy-6-hydroxymethyldihydropteridine diphosphokinase
MEQVSPDFKQPVLAAIALGSNLGNPLANVEAALEMLDLVPGIVVVRRSPWYQTKAVGPPQPDYINGCALLSTTLSPHRLLATLLQVEAKFGRVRRERWAARTLDLDLLLYADRVVDTPDLQIPHPRMGDRAFVLAPLANIAPDWVEPISGRAIAQLLQAVDCSGVTQIEEERRGQGTEDRQD